MTRLEFNLDYYTYRYYNRGDRASYPLCKIGMREWFGIPARLRTITVCVSKRAHAGAYKMKVVGYGTAMGVFDGKKWHTVSIYSRTGRLLQGAAGVLSGEPFHLSVETPA